MPSQKKTKDAKECKKLYPNMDSAVNIRKTDNNYIFIICLVRITKKYQFISNTFFSQSPPLKHM